jgi:hypothetical protein
MSMDGFSGKTTNAATAAPTPAFDPSLLEFLDPNAAAQFAAAGLDCNPIGINPMNLDMNTADANANFAELLASAVGSRDSPTGFRNSPMGYQWSEYCLCAELSVPR